MKKVFERREKEALPVLAICYDFDKTLSPADMQAQGFIQDIGYDVDRFWEESNELSYNNDMIHGLSVSASTAGRKMLLWNIILFLRG